MTAIEIVSSLLEADEIDPKAFARSRDQQIGEYKPILIHGSCGTLKVDPYDGTVIHYDDAPTDDADYDDVAKFDLEELKQWLQANAPKYLEFVRPGGEFDILDVGFWTTTGDYVAAEPDHRSYAFLGAEP